MSKKAKKKKNKPGQGRKKKFEISERVPCVIHTKSLLLNLQQEHETTKNPVVQIINQRLNESYETRPN
jgi:hypothetical protein